MLDQTSAESHLDTALEALAHSEDPYAVLSRIPVPVYVTDAQGGVTYWNQACIDFAGRVPQLGEDRWCVTWKIYTTTGDFLPHDKCPMADAIRTREAVRGAVAIALRPDGRRVAFRPYPTPLFDSAGNFTGAVNMLVDVSDEQVEALSAQASRCRRLADAMYNREASDILASMADRFEQTVSELGRPQDS